MSTITVVEAQQTITVDTGDIIVVPVETVQIITEGVQGPQGAQGADGADGADGQDGVLNWSSSGTYAINDIVNYAGTLYKNLTGTNTSTAPDTDTTNWTPATSGATPAGNDGELQFNDSGDLGASSNLIWDDDNDTFTVKGESVFNAHSESYPNANVKIVKMASAAPFTGSSVGTGIGVPYFSDGSLRGGIYVSNGGTFTLENNLGTKIEFGTSGLVSMTKIATSQTGSTFFPQVRLDATSSKEAGWYVPTFGGEKMIGSVSRTDMLTVMKENVNIGSTTLTGARFIVNTKTSSSVGQIIKAAASQTANLTEWQNSAGTVLASIGSGGTIKLGAAAANYLDATSGNFRIYSGDGTLAWQSGSTTQTFYKRATLFNNSASSVAMIVRGAAAQTASLTEWQNSAGTVGARITANREFSNSLGLSNTEVFGAGATSTNTSSVVLGANASSTATHAGQIVIGAGATATGTHPDVTIGQGATNNSLRSIVIGRGSSVTGSDSVVVGTGLSSAGGHIVGANASIAGGSNNMIFGSTVTLSGAFNNRIAIGHVITGSTHEQISIGVAITNSGFRSISIGQSITNSHTNCIVIGRSATTSAANQLILGGTASPVNEIILQGGEPKFTLDSPVKSFKVKAAPSQTANLQEWQNSAGTALAHVDANGNFVMPNLPTSDPAVSGALYVTTGGALKVSAG